MPTCSKTTPPKDFRDALAWELHVLLDIPFTKNRQPSKGYQIIRIVLNSIIAALHRGERVIIRGLGEFRVVNKIRYKKKGDILWGTPLILSSAPVTYPDRKKVIFIPSRSLHAVMNADTPNARERQQLKVWGPKPTCN